MAFPPNSLRAFLSHAKAALQTALRQRQPITIVVGNESADLDSLTSSLIYAYIRSQAPPKGAFTSLYIPVVNIPAKDVSLRPEFATLFQHANLSVSHLITLDDLTLADQQSPSAELTRWILVDHNKLQGALGEEYSSRTYGTIDHHDDENAVPRETRPEPRIIEKCGSCTSLVVRYLRPSWDALSSSSLSSGAGHAQGDSLIDDGVISRAWDAQVAKLALASILIDTRNLQDSDKTEPADRDAVAYLESKIHLAGGTSSWDRPAFFEAIDHAKRDIDDLALEDILRKDYKQWTSAGRRLGISSVVKPLAFLSAKAAHETSTAAGPALYEAATRFMNTRNLDVYAIMTASTTADGHFQRQLLLRAQPDSSAVVTRFEQRATDELQLQELPAGEREACLTATRGDEGVTRVWTQQNVGVSRKQVAPLLREAIQDGKAM
ncbi:Exopolyphosphatase [Lambiella insularis]|nr:Exopolyphosphatase [Lambiella insularis]